MSNHSLNIEGLTIGSKVFIVHRKYAFQKKIGGKVVAARVVGFHNMNGSVEIIFRQIGQPKSSPDLTVKHWIPFIDINKAIQAIIS